MRDAFLIWGAGGHGKVMADLVRACGHRLAGFVDADPSMVGLVAEAGGGRVVVEEETFLQRIELGAAEPAPFSAVVLGIGNNHARQRGLRFLDRALLPPLVHPSAVVSLSAVLGPGAVVLPGAVVNAEARLGGAAIVNSGAIIEHECEIGEAAHVSPGAILAGGTRVGERSWIGAGATVIEGIAIGADVIVGAGAAVIHDVPDGTTVVGVPARALRGRRMVRG